MNAAAQSILYDFRDRRITYAEFEERMRPWLEIDAGGPGFSVRYRQPLSADVPVAPSVVRHALAAFAGHSLSEPELVRWATVLNVLTEYGPGAEVSDQQADRLELMWDVIARLSSPAIFGALTPETITSYDARLQQLEAAIARDAV